MTDARHDELRETAAHAKTVKAATDETLVATGDVVRRVEALSPPTHPDAVRRWSAARLPIVERDSYEIDGEIAHGGIGRILRGRSVHLDRPVAIKELLDPDADDAERFVCEALLTARLQHPSIVPVYDAGRWPSGELFYAMKLVTGRTLADILEKKPLPLAGRLALLQHVIAVAEAIAYAHSERILHRDLKPANILVGSFGETVVVDWGLAKDLSEPEALLTMGGTPKPPLTMGGTPMPPAEGGARRQTATAAPYRAREALTIAGAVMGTPAYMPPEQAVGLPVDERADVYALGAILYHVLAGVPPYEASNLGALLRAVAEEPPVPLERREKEVGVELCTIVGKAMAREPALRYPTARELAQDLARFAAGQMVGAHKYTRPQLALRIVRRYRAPLAAAAAAMLGISVAVGVGVRHTMAERDRAEQQRILATERADDLTLTQARASAGREPDKALELLASLSPSFRRWGAARVIAADAGAHGLATVLRGHSEVINDIAISPDGRRLATASDDHTVRLWDLATGQSQVLEGHTDEVWVVQFSPDGRRIISTSKDNTLRIWDVEKRTSRALTGHEGGGVSYATPVLGGRRILTWGYDRTAWLWDPGTGEGSLLERALTVVAPYGGRWFAWRDGKGDLWVQDLERGAKRMLGRAPDYVNVLTLSPDASKLALRTRSGHTELWDVASGAHATVFEPEPGSPTGKHVAFSPDGAQLAVAGEGSALLMVSVVTGAARTLDGHQGRADYFVFSPDGRWLAVDCDDNTVQIWDLASGVARTVYGFEDSVKTMVFSPDSRTLVAASYDRTVRVFPVEASDTSVLRAGGKSVSFAAFSPDGEVLAEGDAGGAVRLRDLSQKGAAPVLTPGHARGVVTGAWSPDGSLLATSDRSVVALWDRWGNPRGTFVAKSAVFAFSPDGARLAWAAPDGVGLADLDTGEQRVLKGHTLLVRSLAFSPDGATLASGSKDRTVRLWALPSGESRVLLGHEDSVTALAFSPDGAVLASGGDDHTLRAWDLAAGSGRILDAGGSGVHSVVFSADGATAYTQDVNASFLRVWDTRPWRLRGLMRGHKGRVLSFALSRDGTRLATAGDDATVRLWDLGTGESRALRGHRGAVNDVTFSLDGRTVASAGEDAAVRLWQDDLPTEPAALRAWIQEALRGVSPESAPATPRIGDGRGAGTRAAGEKG